MEWHEQYLITFIEAFAMCYILTPIVRSVALRLGFVDKPGGRHIHKIPIPLLGGVAIYLAFILTSLHRVTMDSDLLGLLVGSTVIVVVGIIDDIMELPAKLKFLGQIIAAVIVVLYGIRIEFVTNPFGGMIYLGAWSIPVTILWIVSITNVINFVDGLDGLAAGVSSIAAFSLFVVAAEKGQAAIALLTIALAASGVGFLRYNFNPARIFMGDTGAMFLGFSLATISVIGALKGATTIALAIPVLALGLPILDTAFAIVRRVENGQPFYVADKGHIHHRLLALGLTQRQAVLLIYFITSLLGVSAVIVAQLGILFGYTAVVLIIALLAFGVKRAGIVDTGSHKGMHKIMQKGGPPAVSM